MSHKRKQARKIKKAMKKQVQKAKQKHEKQEKQLPNQEMLLKLMAMMKGAPGGQPSMDPAKFLEQQEQKATRDAEIRKMKLQEKQVKSDNAAANQQHKVDIAKMAVDDAQRQAQYNQELLALQEEKAGVRGEIRELNLQKEEAQHRIKMNTEHGDLEAEKANRDALKRELQKLEASINHKVKGFVTPEVMEIFRNANDKFKQYNAAVNDLEATIVLGQNTAKQKKLVEKLADELEAGMGEILDINQRLKFDIKQEQDTIKIGEGRVKRVRDLNKENTELEHKIARKKQEAANAGYIINRDENGKPIQVYDDSLLRQLVKPEDDERAKKYEQVLKNIVTYLNDNIANNGDSWHGAIASNFEELEDFRDKAEDYYNQLPTAKKLKVKGKVLNTFDKVVNYYQRVHDKGDKAYKAAEQKYKEDEAHNEAVKSLPKVVKTKPTEDTVAKLEAYHDELKEEYAREKRKAKYQKDLERESEEVVNKINKLEAEIRNSNSEEVSQEQLDALAQLKKQQKKLIRMLDVRNKETKRVESIEDEAADIRFKNAVDSKRLVDSPTSKKTRQRLEEEAIAAQVEAERQRELNKAREMTHKAEQEKRMAEIQENAAQSDKVKELDDKITREKAKGRVAEVQKHQYEELDRVRKDTRNKMVAVDIQKKVNEHLRTHSGSAIQDATTQLAVMGNEIDRQVAAEEKLKNEAKPLIERFERYPAQFETFNKVIRTGDFNGFDTTGQLFDAVQTQQNLQGIKDFFNQYDSGQIHVEDSDEESDW